MQTAANEDQPDVDPRSCREVTMAFKCSVKIRLNLRV